MEQFKIEIFKDEHHGRPFPPFTTLGKEDADRLLQAFARKMHLSEPYDGLILLKALFARSSGVEGVNATSDAFHLLSVLESFSISPEREVYVNWYRFDVIDRMNSVELAAYFPYVWYAGPDDIEIFDDSLSWVLFVDHGGYLRILEISKNR